MTVSVYELVGKNAITIDDGQLVYNEIAPLLKQGIAVELSFEDVEVVASPFFNAAIGQLLGKVSSDDLNRLLWITYLSNDRLHVLSRVIENAKAYFDLSESDRQQTDEILARNPEES